MSKMDLHKDLQVYPHPEYSIVLPADAQLRIHQENHRLYDRFLPHFSKYMAPQSTVVDVGAYCGDTLAAMFATNPSLRFVCIEGDAGRFALLEENVERIHAYDAEAQIQTVQSFVGTGDAGEIGGQLRRLDEILRAESAGPVGLLKSDTDGFDFDVIDSAEAVLERDQPLLYFECENHTPEQKTHYVEMMERLAGKGYSYWAVFDNFGELVLETRELAPVRQLLEYVWRQNLQRTTRTIYYYDILAATERHRVLAEKIVADYIRLA